MKTASLKTGHQGFISGTTFRLGHQLDGGIFPCYLSALSNDNCIFISGNLLNI